MATGDTPVELRKTQSSPTLGTIILPDEAAVAPAAHTPGYLDGVNENTTPSLKKKKNKKKKKKAAKSTTEKDGTTDMTRNTDISKTIPEIIVTEEPFVINGTSTKVDAVSGVNPGMVDNRPAAPGSSNYLLPPPRSAWGSDSTSPPGTTPPTTGSGQVGLPPIGSLLSTSMNHAFSGTPVQEACGSHPCCSHQACSNPQFFPLNSHPIQFPPGLPIPAFYDSPACPTHPQSQKYSIVPSPMAHAGHCCHHQPYSGPCAQPTIIGQQISHQNCGYSPLGYGQNPSTGLSCCSQDNHNCQTGEVSAVASGRWNPSVQHALMSTESSAVPHLVATSYVEERFLNLPTHEAVPPASIPTLESIEEEDQEEDQESEEGVEQAKDLEFESASTASLESRASPVDKESASVTPPPCKHLLDLADVKELESLPTFLLGAFEREEFTDCRIILSSSGDNFYPITFNVHKVIMARSPLLASLLRKDKPLKHVDVINAIAGGHFCMARAYEAALQALYGLPLLNKEQLQRLTLSALGYSETSERTTIKEEAYLDFALCYAVSGVYFANLDVADAGMHLAKELLSWDTVELALQFGLSVTDFVVTYSEATLSKWSKAHASSGAEEPAFKDTMCVHEFKPAKVLQIIYGPTILTAALDWLIDNLPPDFQKTYDIAEVTLMPDRVPSHLVLTPWSVRHNPRIATMKFGQMPSLIERRPGKEIYIPSAVLLALPFDAMKQAYEIMAEKQKLERKLVLDLLFHRERRRRNAIRTYSKENKAWKGDFESLPAHLKWFGYMEVMTYGYTETVGDRTLLKDTSVQEEWIGVDKDEWCDLLDVSEILLRHTKSAF